MPVIAGRTREQIRVSIGYNLMGEEFIVSSTTRSGGDANSVIDRNRLFGGANAHIGKWCVATSGTNDGEIRRVTAFTQGTLGKDSAPTDADPSHLITLATPFSTTVPTSMTYELWTPRFRPEMVHEVINQVILSTYGRAYDLVIDATLHTGGSVSRYAIPSTLAAISEVAARTTVELDEIKSCDSAFDETVESGLTVTTDDEDFKRGGTSVKITVAAGAAASAKATDSLTSLDLRGKTHAEFWVKSSITAAAGDIQLLLDDTASCASPLETLNVPALVAGEWQFVQVALANPESDSAIISVGVQFTTDNGAQIFWIDQIDSTDQNTAQYEVVSRRAWSIDVTANELLLTAAALSQLPYNLLRLSGGDEPALASADSTAMEINEWYVICAATAQIFAQAHGRYGDDSYLRSATLWKIEARAARKGLSRLRRSRKT